jgi:hypothetical protein
MRIQIRDPKTLTLYPGSGMEKFGSGMIFKTHTVLNTLHNYISYSTVCAKKELFSKAKIYPSPFFFFMKFPYKSIKLRPLEW